MRSRPLRGILMLALAWSKLVVSTSFAAPLSAQELLWRADEVRNPQLDYMVMVTITSVKPTGGSRTATYQVFVQGREHAVVQTLSPPVDKGRVLLMRGKDLWAFLPMVSKPIRISLRERLLGEVANGDVARANFSGDYTPTLMKEEDLEGHHYAVLELTANANDVTYGKVRLWVNMESFYPHHAEFYAISGRLLKTCSYEQYRQIGGRLRPTLLVLHDPLVKGQYSLLTYDQMRIAPLPEKYFTKDYMKKFME